MRGQKSSPELIYKIMMSYAVTGSYAQTSKDAGVPESTVRKIVSDNANKPEFVELCAKKKTEFAETASALIDKGLQLLYRRFTRALDHEYDLDILIDEIFATGKEELTQDEKNRLVTKIRALQLQDVKSITTAIGTLYDKRALAKGESTVNNTVSIKLPDGADDYAI